MIDFNIEKINQKVNNANLHATPVNIADDMIELLVDTGFFNEPNESMTAEDYISSHRVLDIYCKSGSLLYACYKRFMIALRHAIPNKDDRDYFIVRNLLYGLCPSISCINTLRDMFYNNKKYDLSHELGNFFLYDLEKEEGSDKDIVKELLKPMKFDVVVGNPPYNNDAYLDFVMLGHKLAKSYDLWITPAKFNFARNNDKYKAIWKDILAYMTDCVFYQCEGEIFKITLPCGIAYYLCSKEHTDSINLVNKSSNFSGFTHNLVRIDKDCKSFNIMFNEISSKLGNSKINIDFDSSKMFKVIGNKTINTTAGDSGHTSVFYCRNTEFKKALVIGKLSVSLKDSEKSMGLTLKSFDSSTEAESFISFIDSKLIRYIIACSLQGYANVYSSYTLDFIPSPGNFDKVYEDRPLDGYTPDENGIYIDKDGVVHCSLYVKYKLTQQEIDVIESVIRERK